MVRKFKSKQNVENKHAFFKKKAKNARVISKDMPKYMDDASRAVICGVAKKSLGQNFIIDSSVTDSIAASFVHSNDFKEDALIVEIGPGLGMLTSSILDICKPQKMILVEMDDRLITHLKQRYQDDESAQVEVRHQDALTMSEADFLEIARNNGQKCNIIANLPYNIGTPLLFHWFDNIEHFNSITIMLQREVAERIIAQPGTTHRSWLSIISQMLCEVVPVLNVSNESFWPRPKVQSQVVRLTPRKRRLYPEVDISKLRKICDKAFRQRRKMLRNTFSDIDMRWDLLNIDASARPQDLSLQDWVEIYRLLSDV